MKKEPYFYGSFCIRSMVFTHLQLQNFKNYRHAHFEFHPVANIIVGRNGAGKTSILDALHIVSFTKSFLNHIDSQLIYFSEDWYSITARIATPEEYHIFVGFKKNEKKVVKCNHVAYTRLADHIGTFPLVVISPEDSAIIYEGSEIRRRFIDSTLSQCNKEYLQALIRYQAYLKQRNACLKSLQDSSSYASLIEVLNEKMDKEAAEIYAERKKFMEEFQLHFKESYQRISGCQEEVQIQYESDLHQGMLSSLLNNTYDTDLKLQYTSCGIHKDDLIFYIQEKPLKKYASQGQQKTFLLALKLAQGYYLYKKKKVYPFLLLDDIYDKLDSSRLAAFFQTFYEQDKTGQVFITDTDKDRIPSFFRTLGVEYKLIEL